MQPNRRAKISTLTRKPKPTPMSKMTGASSVLPSSISQKPLAPVQIKKEEISEEVDSDTIVFYDWSKQYYELSNFYPHQQGKKLRSLHIIYDGQEWPTSEHLYQALKFRCETQDEINWRNIIRTASTPGIARHLGRQMKLMRYKWQQDASAIVREYEPYVHSYVNDYDNEEDRDEFLLYIMREALAAKFEASKQFRLCLKSTLGKKLMEDDNNNWGWTKGWLGMLLEEIREQHFDKEI